MNQELIKTIKNSIAKAELNRAFEIAFENLNDNSEYKDSLISLVRQYEKLNEVFSEGIINQENYHTKVNQIASNFLGVLNDIEFKLNEKDSVFYEALDDKEFEKLILDRISKGELSEAFNFLEKWIGKNNPQDSNLNEKFLLLLSRYNSNKSDDIRGLITKDTIRNENIKTAKGLVDLIHSINEAPKIKKQEEEKKQQIESSAASFVQESISELSKREKKLKFQAIVWYLIGFASLVCGIIAALTLVVTNESELKLTVGIIYLSLKSLIIVGLLIAASRYAFNLGKTYMNESLKNADRIHAISFGKFYLQVFGTNVKPEDLKDVFKDWNTVQESQFMKLDSSEFDPQLLQAFLKFTEVLKIGKK